MSRILPAVVASLVWPLAVQAQRLPTPSDSTRQRQLGEVTVYATRLGQLAGQTAAT